VEIGNKTVRGQGLHLVAVQSAIFIFDTHMSFMEPAECERVKVDGPETVVDSFQVHVLPGADGGDIDPVRVPARSRRT
jgi:hypothetical protein